MKNVYGMVLKLVLIWLLIPTCLAQKSMEQDPALNNLVHPPGYRTLLPGQFGHVEKRGSGPVSLILIPGGGFGWDVFSDFMELNREVFTMYAVSLAGMGGTSAPPMPPEGTSYGDQTWIQGAVTAVLDLIRQEKLDRPVVVSHFLAGSHIGFRLARDHPDQIRGVVVLAGSAKMAQPGLNITLEQRVRYMDQQMSQNWFKTVTLKTWNDNNFSPDTYSIDPARGLKLFDQVDDGPLPIFIRYLLEFHSGDLSLQLGQVSAPVLLLLPGFKPEVLDNPDLQYLHWYFLDSWKGAEEHPLIRKKSIAGAHLLPWLDQPQAVSEEIRSFAASLP